MNSSLSPPEIFDRRRRRALRERAGRRSGESFLWNYIAEDLAERVSMVARDFEHVLIIGPIAKWQEQILPDGDRLTVFAPLSQSESMADDCPTVEEDRLPFEGGTFDLIISAGTLDSVNDLPGALIQIRRLLKPDGLFLGHMFGAGTLSSLKSAMMAVEEVSTAPHIHPQIDLRNLADLLTRAGFALPVADTDMLPVLYADWRSVVSDLRDAGIGNALSGSRRYLGKKILQRLDAEWKARADEAGRVIEQYAHLNLSGWGPSSNQPKPLRRGSAVVSLNTVLSKPVKI